MTLQTRLTLVVILAHAGLIGLAVVLIIWIPSQASEFLKRDQSRQLDKAENQIMQMLESLTETDQQKLKNVAASPSVIEQAKQAKPSAETLADSVRLAENLATKHHLQTLSLIDKNGVYRSLYPEAARIGMTDRTTLEQANDALGKPLLISAPIQSDKAETILARWVLAVPVLDQSLFVLTMTPLTRDHLHSVAAKAGVKLRFAKAGEAPSLPAKQADERRLVIKNKNGKRLITMGIGPIQQNSAVLKTLLFRQLLFITVPWIVFLSLLLIWIGWPKPKKVKTIRKHI